MKKISLFTLAAAVVAMTASAANAGTTMTNLNDPLNLAADGVFYSKSDLSVGAIGDKHAGYVLGQEFGYGITDRLNVTVNGGYTLGKKHAETNFGLDAGLADLGLGLTYRVVRTRNFVADVYGQYIQNMGPEVSYDKVGNTGTSKDDRYKSGVRGGFIFGDWTLAAGMEYGSFVSPKKLGLGHSADGLSYWTEAQWRFASHMSANVRYDWTDAQNGGEFYAATRKTTAQLNYHFSQSKTASLYYAYDYQVVDLGNRAGNPFGVVGVKFAASF